MKIEDLKNCTTLKQQFAFELWHRTLGVGLHHRTAIEAAEEIMQRFYPCTTSPAFLSQLAIEWTNDKIVADAYLRISNAAAQDEFLPTRSQFALAIADELDGINALALNARGATKRKAHELRSLFLANRDLLMQVLQR